MSEFDVFIECGPYILIGEFCQFAAKVECAFQNPDKQPFSLTGEEETAISEVSGGRGCGVVTLAALGVERCSVSPVVL